MSVVLACVGVADVREIQLLQLSLWTQIRAEVAAMTRSVLPSAMEDEEATRTLWCDVLGDLLSARTTCNDNYDVPSKIRNDGDATIKNRSDITQIQTGSMEKIDRYQFTTIRNWLNGEKIILRSHLDWNSHINLRLQKS